MKIAIIDIIGIPYDGSTLDKQGLGGSESAVILISTELSKLNFDVTVFNHCDTDHTSPGVYNGVHYRPLNDLGQDHAFDIVISSRTVIPFLDPDQYFKLDDTRCNLVRDFDLYQRVVKNSIMRVLWMHDTFCLGDNLIEELTISNRITDIFTLSDWHTAYITNCNHGVRRNFEVLKRKIFQTRNGIKNYIPQVDIAAKDTNLFVYNASVSKGMIPLVKEIWPRIKQRIPQARLKIIGGYYKFSSEQSPDQQELDWQEMFANQQYNQQFAIEFTGIITQREIAKILALASYTIYPAAFPETFGISSLESLLYNTPLITCRFGGLEELALENACYLIDYPIEPNSLFTSIDKQTQIEKFVELTVAAHQDTYLHQQKQYYCNIVKDVAGWDSVAAQWQQHFYRKFNTYLPRSQYRKVSKINHTVNKIWKRRFHNESQLEYYKSGNEQEIIIISPFYNCKDYIRNCIASVAQQDYDSYTHILIDDASTDGSADVARQCIDLLPDDIAKKFILIENDHNVGAVCNQIQSIRGIENDQAIVMLLDGDDSLVNDNTIFSYYNSIYDGNVEFTYGSCWSLVDKIPLISQPYPDHVKNAKSYRQHRFNWGMPYTHLRTFKKHLINQITDESFKDCNGVWYRAGGDNAVFYSLIESANPAKIKCLQEVVYNYNDCNPINDYKVNADEQNATAQKIMSDNSNTIRHPLILKKRILIAIPTARYIEPETFKSIYDLKLPDYIETDFQHFHGYRIDQVRNLIARWATHYDYLFSVDSDIAFEPSTLARLLEHDQDIVSGLYVQRKFEKNILELYRKENDGVINIDYDTIKNQGLVEVAGCGFGCVLIKSQVLKSVGYPQFEYHPALDHNETVSEDLDFCFKAADRGYKIWADTAVKCRHIGQHTFQLD